MKQYLLSVWHREGQPEIAPGDMEAVYRDVDALNQELQQSGAWVFGGGLAPVSSATALEAKGGEVMVTDGPFAESKEYLGGFWVIKADDLDAAMVLAKKAALACRGPVELRPFEDEPAAE